MNQSIRLGRVAGIPIGINWSVLLIATLIGWSLAASALPEIAPGETTVAYAVAGTVAALLFFASLLAHELAHALVVRRDGVAVHSITLWLLGGVSRFESEPPTADSELRISLAGPLTSLALALSFGMLELLSEASHLRDLVSGSLAWLAFINLVLGLFNLLPAYPLDGGRVLRALAWRHSRDRVAATRVAARTGHVLAWCLIGLGMLVALTGLVVSGLWLVLIGWFVDNAGRAEAAAVVERSVLGAVPVDRLMSADPVTVPGSLTVERLVHDYVLGRHHSAFPVTDDRGATIGLVTLDQVRGVPTEQRNHVTVAQVALPLDQVPVVAPTDSGVDALQRIAAARTSRALVIDADRGLVGIVSNSDLARALDVGSVRRAGHDGSSTSTSARPSVPAAMTDHPTDGPGSREPDADRPPAAHPGPPVDPGSPGVAPDVPADSTGSAAHGRAGRRVLLVFAGAAVFLLLMGGETVGRYLLRDRPGAKSVDSAVEQFRSDTSTTDAAPAGFTRPAAGVYQANGEGEERISTPPNSQNDGAVMPISVKYLPEGCWTWHLDYNQAHWHEFDFCPEGAHLLLVAQRNYQSWDFGVMKVENVGTYTCDPPAPVVVDDPSPGMSFVHRCTGDNTAAPGASTSEGPATIVGAEMLSIGGTDVPTIRQRRTQKMSGTQQGSIEEDWWFAADTGLPVRSERHYQIESGSVIGTITYTETGSWQLASMQPET